MQAMGGVIAVVADAFALTSRGIIVVQTQRTATALSQVLASWQGRSRGSQDNL